MSIYLGLFIAYLSGAIVVYNKTSLWAVAVSMLLNYIALKTATDE